MIGLAKMMALVTARSTILAGCATKQTDWRSLAAEIETVNYRAYGVPVRRHSTNWAKGSIVRTI